MTSERSRRVEELFHAALERREEDRAAFLARECDGDETLRSEVESLLAQRVSSAPGFRNTLPPVAPPRAGVLTPMRT